MLRNLKAFTVQQVEGTKVCCHSCSTYLDLSHVFQPSKTSPNSWIIDLPQLALWPCRAQGACREPKQTAGSGSRGQGGARGIFLGHGRWFQSYDLIDMSYFMIRLTFPPLKVASGDPHLVRLHVLLEGCGLWSLTSGLAFTYIMDEHMFIW